MSNSAKCRGRGRRPLCPTPAASVPQMPPTPGAHCNHLSLGSGPSGTARRCLRPWAEEPSLDIALCLSGLTSLLPAGRPTPFRPDTLRPAPTSPLLPIHTHTHTLPPPRPNCSSLLNTCTHMHTHCAHTEARPGHTSSHHPFWSFPPKASSLGAGGGLRAGGCGRGAQADREEGGGWMH